MLKTNSTIAKMHIWQYIANNVTIYDEKGREVDNCGYSYNKLGHYIYKYFLIEYGQYEARYVGYQEAFYKWCSGLPNVLNVDDIFLNSAVKTLGDILEETEEERNKFSEEDAERLFCYLVFRLCQKAYYLIENK